VSISVNRPHVQLTGGTLTVGPFASNFGNVVNPGNTGLDLAGGTLALADGATISGSTSTARAPSPTRPAAR
jgi:hypothetical protein